MRVLATATSLLLLFLAPLVGAQEAGLSGNWKFSFYDPEKDQLFTFWLLKLDKQDGKLTGSIETIEKGVPKTTLDNFRATDNLLQFTMKLANGPTFEFEGRLPKKEEPKTIFGSFRRHGGPVTPALLQATTAKGRLDLTREEIKRNINQPKAFTLVLDLLEQGKDAGLSPKEARELVTASLGAADLYGPRWRAQYLLKLVDALKDQTELKDVTVDLAREIEKSLDAKAPVSERLQALNTLADALRGAKQVEEAKQIEQKVAKLETAAYKEHKEKGVGFKVEKSAGKDTGRTVLFELFTGAQCPPCYAADVAFDAVAEAYQPKEVVLLQYHVHIPGPDPLTSPASENRFEYYAAKFEEAVGGTPASIFNGRPAALGGGGPDDAEEKFKEYRSVIQRLGEKASPVQLSAEAVRKGDKVTVKANVKGVENPGDKLRLRFALVEDWAHYKGRSGIPYHHRIVRAMPGGAKGFALTEKAGEQTAKVDLGELRQELSKFLSKTPIPGGVPSARFRDLHVVAFVQNDATAEVLQAVDVPVREEGERE